MSGEPRLNIDPVSILFDFTYCWPCVNTFRLYKELTLLCVSPLWLYTLHNVDPVLIPLNFTQCWPWLLRQVADLPESRHGHSAVRLGDSVVVCGGLSGRHIHERWDRDLQGELEGERRKPPIYSPYWWSRYLWCHHPYHRKPCYIFSGTTGKWKEIEEPAPAGLAFSGMAAMGNCVYLVSVINLHINTLRLYKMMTLCQYFLTLHNIDPMSRWAAGRISTPGTTLRGTGSTPLGSWSTAPPGQCSFSSFKQRILPIKHIN